MAVESRSIVRAEEHQPPSLSATTRSEATPVRINGISYRKSIDRPSSVGHESLLAQGPDNTPGDVTEAAASEHIPVPYDQELDWSEDDMGRARPRDSKTPTSLLGMSKFS